MKKIRYKLTYIFLIIGFILSIFLFFNSSSLIYYGESIVIFTLIIGSIGWMIDKFKLKQPVIPIILIIIYLLVGGFYLYSELNSGHCASFSIDEYKNVITNECKQMTIPCYDSPAWYLKEDQICTESILKERCNSLTEDQLLPYNNSCDIYVEINSKIH